MTDHHWLPVPVPSPSSKPPDSTDAARRLVAAFVAGRSPQTVRAYQQDLADFGAFVGMATPPAAAQFLLSSGPGVANELALRYKADLLSRGLAAATVNRRLAALRS